MGDLTKNFSRKEFECPCGCGFDTVDFELVMVAQDISDHFNNQPVIITGPNRCKEHNEEIQKQYNPKYVPYSSKSMHMKAKAMDFKVIGVHPDRVANYLEKKYSNKYGIGRYNDRTHVDVRKRKARWDNRTK